MNSTRRSSRFVSCLFMAALVALTVAGLHRVLATTRRDAAVRDDLATLESRFLPLRTLLARRDVVGFTSDRIRGGGHRWFYALQYTIAPIAVRAEPIVGPNQIPLLERVAAGYALVFDFDDATALESLLAQAREFLTAQRVPSRVERLEPGLAVLLTSGE